MQRQSLRPPTVPDDTTKTGPPKLGRVALVYTDQGAFEVGGASRAERDGFECHSYETELYAFQDLLARAGKGASVVCITDCLSAASALCRSPMLSDGAIAGRYRARLLADIGQRVQTMTAVHFLWVHSHILLASRLTRLQTSEPTQRRIVR